MSENGNDQHKDWRENKQGIATVAGIVVFVALGVLTRNDLLFGLVMATVYGAGMQAGKKILSALTEREQADSMPAKIVAVIVVGIVASLIISLVQGTGLITPMEDDNIIITIVKHFFDNNAAAALAIGALVGIYVHGMDSD